MTNTPHDPVDQAMEQYLRGDSEVSRRYGEERARDEVPEHLDLLVRRHAADAVRSKRTAHWLRWTAPLAAAASVVLVVSIVRTPGVSERAAVQEIAPAPAAQEVPVEPPPQSSAASPAPPAYAETNVTTRAPELAPRLPPQAPAAAAERKQEQREASARHSAGDQSEELESVVVTSQKRATALQETPVSVMPIDSTQLEEAVVDAAGAPEASTQRSAADAPASDSSVEPAGAAALEAPEQWLDRIRRLRESGDVASADEELKRFREAYPDYELPTEQ